MPPLVLAGLGTLGVAALARFLVRESRRVNGMIDPHRGPPSPEPPGERLEKDPVTGTYRPRARS
ncbi:hypothetical protein ABLE91_07505 [Aquabacter sp. CN5-332]|uniref:hypothetical protein n=1 Tax=Aquabacter sp. CN5-332 TaxID=3156608 RepID=UPI0032B37D7B